MVPDSASHMREQDTGTVLTLSWLLQMDMPKHCFTDHLCFPNGIPI